MRLSILFSIYLSIVRFLIQEDEKGMPCNPATVPAAVNGDGNFPYSRHVHCLNYRTGRRRIRAVSQKTCLLT